MRLRNYALKLTKGVCIRRVNPDAQYLIMTRKILAALTTIGFVLCVLASPQFAQERGGAGVRVPIGDRSVESRLVLDGAEAEKIRRDLLVAYEESEALIRYFASYEFVRQSNDMKEFDALCQDMALERLRIKQLSAVGFMQEVNNMSYAKNLGNIIKLSQSIRTDEQLKVVLRKVDLYFQAGLLNKTPSTNDADIRGVIAAPAYIAPNCNFDDPSNYPSGVDLGIANGVALALQTAVEVQPADILIFCTTIPNPFRAVFAVLSGIARQVANALKGVASDAAYCESIRLYVEEQLTPDGGQNAIMMNDDYYLTFTYRSVKAAVTKATSLGVPTNCGTQRLTEAAAFFNGSDTFIGTGPQRVDAFKKLRAAYRNIGASSCLQ